MTQFPRFFSSICHYVHTTQVDSSGMVSLPVTAKQAPRYAVDVVVVVFVTCSRNLFKFHLALLKLFHCRLAAKLPLQETLRHRQLPIPLRGKQ